jgi:pimeloyl-ACP methyl ester carboxylesterase
MTAVTVQGVPIYVTERGAGPPVVLLHGNPDSGNVWNAVVDKLSANFRCIAPDLPGYGRSVPAPETDYTLAGQARWLHDFLDAIQLSEPVNLVGHDVGGFYASSFICEHEARVRRLALMDTQFFTGYRWHFWGRVWRTPLLGELSMALMNGVLFARETRRGAVNMPRDYPKQAYEFVTPDMKRGVLKLYRLMDPRGFTGWEERLRAAAGRVPTLVIWGDHDPYIAPRFAERFGTTNVHHLANAGHWPMIERPAEVAELLRKHFSSDP